MLHLHAMKAPIKSFDELGMRAKTQEQLKELTSRPAGFVLFSSLPVGGLSALFDSVLKNCDRYMRDFASVEEVNHREHDVENLPVTTYNASKGETATAAVDKITRTYPNVIVMRTLPDMATAKLLCDQVAEDRLVLTAIRAKDATEAMLRVLLLKVPPKDFVNAISGVCCRAAGAEAVRGMQGSVSRAARNAGAIRDSAGESADALSAADAAGYEEGLPELRGNWL